MAMYVKHRQFLQMLSCIIFSVIKALFVKPTTAQEPSQ